ncbi:hypothetical protein BC940DRAFT_323143 [Gongronella butleri]|nr:hypothetical protein BC940DRAFT_323143 [Gongronella butleri]
MPAANRAATPAKKAKAPHTNEAFSGKLDFRPTMTDQVPEHQLKSMSPKERRQLRNKISARNFRNRRKEYIETIEEQLNDSKHENDQLRAELATLRKEMQVLRETNQQLRLDLVLYEQGVHPMAMNPLPATTTPPHSMPATTPPTSSLDPASGTLVSVDDLFTTSSGSSDSSNATPSPTTTTDLTIMGTSPLGMDPMWPNFNMFLSHALLPDLSAPLAGKTRDATAANMNVMDVFHRYPLLAPALMSIVVGHTMSLSTDDLLRLNLSPAAIQADAPSEKEAFKVWELLEPSLQAAMTTIHTQKAITYDDDQDETMYDASDDASTLTNDYNNDATPAPCPIQLLRYPMAVAHRYMKTYVCAVVQQYVAQYCVQQQQQQQQKQQQQEQQFQEQEQEHGKCSIYATFKRCKDRFVVVS